MVHGELTELAEKIALRETTKWTFGRIYNGFLTLI